MLLGIESGIPDELYDQFNATGSSHVIVISGSNVALIAGVIMALMVRVLGGKRAVWFTLAGIACYALLVGGDAAVMRAAVMGSLAVIATGSTGAAPGW
jgi:competence protein ComEC